MEKYSALLGKRVAAQYRAGYLNLSASGILISDSGDAIHIEDRFLQNGKNKMMRVEIPYSCILHVGEAEEEVAAASTPAAPGSKKDR